MRTLTLDLDHLRVDSFPMGSAEPLQPVPTNRTQEPGCTAPTLCNGTAC